MGKRLLNYCCMIKVYMKMSWFFLIYTGAVVGLTVQSLRPAHNGIVFIRLLILYVMISIFNFLSLGKLICFFGVYSLIRFTVSKEIIFATLNFIVNWMLRYNSKKTSQARVEKEQSENGHRFMEDDYSRNLILADSLKQSCRNSNDNSYPDDNFNCSLTEAEISLKDGEGI